MQANESQRRLEAHLERRNQSCMSYWFPKLSRCSVPMPRTRIIPYERGFQVMESKTALYELTGIICREVIDLLGYPCQQFFLRTGHTSHKHDYLKTCLVQRRREIPRHIWRIADFSCSVDMLGLPLKVWVIREYINLYSSFAAFGGSLPIAKERRYFINQCRVQCHHPYWPVGAIERTSIKPGNWQSLLSELNQEDDLEVKLLTEMSAKVAQQFNGYWSLDWAMDVNGIWYAIDMARGEDSFHMPGCPYCSEVGL